MQSSRCAPLNARSFYFVCLHSAYMGFRLTKKLIESLTPPSAGYVIHWDDELRGFGLRVTDTGARSFILQARIKRRERRMTIGRYPGVVPEIARREAKRLLGQIAGGGDPMAERARQKLAAITLEEVFDEYAAEHNRRDGKPLKERTKRDMRCALNETFPDWKPRPITAITRDMVKSRYAERAQKSVARANIAMRYLRAVLNFAAASYRDAEGKPILSDNPVRVLSESGRWKRVAPRKRTLSDRDLSVWVPAVLALGDVPKREPGAGRLKPKLRNGDVFRDFFLFVALNGVRKSEALGLRKSHVDLEARTVLFPDTKNRTDHVLPLTNYSYALLERRMRASAGELVFEGTDGPISNPRYAIERIAEDTGVVFSAHDLRRLCATTLERLGVPWYTIKAVLNHLPGAADVTGCYVQVDDAMKRAALEKLEAFILRFATPPAKVVELRRA